MQFQNFIEWSPDPLIKISYSYNYNVKTLLSCPLSLNNYYLFVKFVLIIKLSAEAVITILSFIGMILKISLEWIFN